MTDRLRTRIEALRADLAVSTAGDRASVQAELRGMLDMLQRSDGAAVGRRRRRRTRDDALEDMFDNIPI